MAPGGRRELKLEGFAGVAGAEELEFPTEVADGVLHAVYAVEEVANDADSLDVDGKVVVPAGEAFEVV